MIHPITAQQAVAQLARSERGRAIASDLFELLDGPFIGADPGNQQAVLALVRIYTSGHPVDVLTALRGLLDDEGRAS